MRDGVEVESRREIATTIRGDANWSGVAPTAGWVPELPVQSTATGEPFGMPK
jgi:hypothetical protein